MTLVSLNTLVKASAGTALQAAGGAAGNLIGVNNLVGEFVVVSAVLSASPGTIGRVAIQRGLAIAGQAGVFERDLQPVSNLAPPLTGVPLGPPTPAQPVRNLAPPLTGVPLGPPTPLREVVAEIALNTKKIPAVVEANRLQGAKGRGDPDFRIPIDMNLVAATLTPPPVLSVPRHARLRGPTVGFVSERHPDKRFLFAQYVPPEYSEKRQYTWSQATIPGLEGPVYQFINGGTRTLSLTLMFNSYGDDPSWNQRGQAVDDTFVERQLRQLYRLAEPRLQTQKTLKRWAPDRLCMVFGHPGFLSMSQADSVTGRRSLPVYITDINVKRSFFKSTGAAQRAFVTINVAKITDFVGTSFLSTKRIIDSLLAQKNEDEAQALIAARQAAERRRITSRNRTSDVLSDLYGD